MRYEYNDIETLKKLYDQSAPTIEGLLEEGREGRSFAETMMTEFKNCHWMKDDIEEIDYYVIKGEAMNDLLSLTSSNRYPADLNIVSFKMDDFIEDTRFYIERMAYGIRWMDDIVDNNIRRENPDISFSNVVETKPAFFEEVK